VPPPDYGALPTSDRPSASICPRSEETTRYLLDQILATSHTELTATETWEAHHPGVAAPLPPLRASSSTRHPDSIEPQRRTRSAL